LLEAVVAVLVILYQIHLKAAVVVQVDCAQLLRQQAAVVH
jgi:hypothetical protein